VVGSTDNVFDTVLKAISLIGEVKIIKQDARNALKRFYKFDNLNLKSINNHIFVGNSCSLDLIRLLQFLNSKIATFYQKIASKRVSYNRIIVSYNIINCD